MPLVNMQIIRDEIKRDQPDYALILTTIMNDKDLQTSENSRRLLRSACLNGKPEVLKFLIEKAQFREFSYDILECACQSEKKAQLLEILFNVDEFEAKVPEFLRTAQANANNVIVKTLLQEFDNTPAKAQPQQPEVKTKPQAQPQAQPKAQPKPAASVKKCTQQLAAIEIQQWYDKIQGLPEQYRGEHYHGVLNKLLENISSKNPDFERIKSICDIFSQQIAHNSFEILICAARTNNAKVIKAILEHPALQAYMEAVAPNVFKVACRQDLRIAVATLRAVATVKNIVTEGFNIACTQKNTVLAEQLLRSSKDVQRTAHEMLATVCANGDKKLTAQILKLPGAQEQAGEALRRALQAGNHNTVEMLLTIPGMNNKLAEIATTAFEKNDLRLINSLMNTKGANEPLEVAFLQLIANADVLKISQLIINKDISNSYLMGLGLEAALAAKKATLVKNFSNTLYVQNEGIGGVLSKACFANKTDIVTMLKNSNPVLFANCAANVFLEHIHGNINANILAELYTDKAVKQMAEEVFAHAIYNNNTDVLNNLFTIDHFKQQIPGLLQNARGNVALIKILLDHLEYNGIKASKVLNPNDHNVIAQWQQFINNPLQFLANKPFIDLQLRQAIEIIGSQQQIRVELAKEAGNKESAQDNRKENRARIHLRDVVKPEFQQRFNALGATDEARTAEAYRQIRGLILDEIQKELEEKVQKNPTKVDRDSLDFIRANKPALMAGNNYNLMHQAYRYFSSNTNKNHLAWRTLDVNAPRDVNGERNYITEPLFFLENYTNLQVRNDSREWLAYFFLAVTDNRYPEDRANRVANFIGELADIRRADNIDKEDNIILVGPDRPSCYKGTLGRIANMGRFHPTAQIPQGSADLAIDMLKNIVMDAFHEAMGECVDNIARENLFKALVDLNDKTVGDVANGKNYNLHLAQIRDGFINARLGGVDAVIHRLEAQLKHQGYPDLSDQDKAIVQAEILNIGSDKLEPILGRIYGEYCVEEALSPDQIKALVTNPKYNPYQVNTPHWALFKRLAEVSFTIDTCQDAILHAVKNIIDANVDFANPEEQQFKDILIKNGTDKRFRTEEDFNDYVEVLVPEIKRKNKGKEPYRLEQQAQPVFAPGFAAAGNNNGSQDNNRPQNSNFRPKP